MIVEYIRYTIAEDRRSSFEAAYQRAAESLDASPECQGYELARCVDDPGQYILRIEWDSVEAHMQGFRRSPQFRAFFGAIGPYVNDIREMRHYEVTTVSSRSS